MSHVESADRLVIMANQIGTFFGSQRRGNAGQAVAQHLHKFWTPGMRDRIKDHLEAGGEGLNDAARAGVAHLDDIHHDIPVGPDDDSSTHEQKKPGGP